MPLRSDRLAGRLIAVLDDDPDAIAAMRALFGAQGAEVAGAATADGLLDDLGRHARYPDLVVADLRLAAGATGIDAIARLRDELGAPVAALIVSGDTSLEAAQAVADAGLPMLPKPVEPQTLLDMTADLIPVPPESQPRARAAAG
jgi:CheY-like chemotaxis protein